MRPPLPPLLFFACLGAAAAVEWLVPLPHARYSFETGAIGAATLVIVGAAIAAQSIRELKRSRTTIEPNERPSALVTSGPFRFTRNPMYLALVVVAAGIAAGIGSIWFLGAAVVLFVLLDILVVRPEERVVGDVFGAEYFDYCRKVRRWL